MSVKLPDDEGPVRWPVRLIGRPRPEGGYGPEDRAAALLWKLREPAPLSAAALARTFARLEEATARPPQGRPIWLLAPALAGAAALALFVLRPGAPPQPVASLVAPPALVEKLAPADPARLPLTIADGAVLRRLHADAELLLLGPASASLDADSPIALHSGRLLVRGGPAALLVTVPGARVAVRPGAVVQISIRAQGGLRVAAYGGTAALERPGETLLIATTGVAVEQDGARSELSVAERLEVDRLLGTKSSSLPIAKGAPRPPAKEVSTSELARTAANEAPLPESALAAESRLLSDALGRLRQGDGAGALALLGEHRTRFPQGALLQEAQGARIDALLLLGRRQAALADLDAATLDGRARGAELQLLRAELRAEAGRCAQALSDFGATIDGRDASAALLERAYYGRATCRARGGDEGGAQADLRLYLARFPGGRFSDAAREALGK